VNTTAIKQPAKDALQETVQALKLPGLGVQEVKIENKNNSY
jgi:hypothetical protein